MAQFDSEKIKKYKKGELWGNIALIFCAAVLVYFIVVFTLSWVQNNAVLQTVVWVTAAPLMVIGVSVAAYCNLKFGNGITEMIKKYVTEVFIENASAMHPDKSSLSFFIEISDTCVIISVNGFKEKIIFDFSVFGRFTLARKSAAVTIISDKLTATFCKLYERGTTYKSVDYREKAGTSRKSGKTVPIIVNGVPDKRAMKSYIKNR